jgi:predicted SAM-dependent methyltransferase
MSISQISLRRPLTSYAKVQALVGWLIRGRPFQLRSPRVTSKQYLDVGCGPNTHEGFINLEYRWHPGIDLCWDVTRGIPLPDHSLRGIFSEHCLEHFPLPTVYSLLHEFKRLLAPGGTVRIIVPDAELYFDIYDRKRRGDGGAVFPYEEHDSFQGIYSPLLSVNRIYYTDRHSPAGHRCMFDHALTSALLTAAGFRDVRRESFRKGRDPGLLIDTESRAVESLYVEASAP